MSETYRERFDRALSQARTALPRLSPMEVERLGTKVLKQPRARRLTLFRSSARYRSPQVCEWLMARAHAVRFDDPEGMVDMASCAVDLAELLGGPLPAVLAADLQAEALAGLGNALRVKGDLVAAGEYLDRAARRLDSGSGDPLVVARVACLRGVHAVDVEDYPRALQLYTGAFRTYSTLGETHLAGRTLVSLGRACSFAGHAEPALECLWASLGLIDVATEPTLVILAVHSMALALVEAGRGPDAGRLLRLSLPLYEVVYGRVIARRFRWMEGKILTAAGLYLNAEAVLTEVRKGFLEQSIAYDAALVSLDLAAVYLRTRRLAEVVALGQEMHAVFTSQGLADRAAAALLLLVKAAQEQRLTAEILTQVASQIQAARKEQRERS